MEVGWKTRTHSETSRDSSPKCAFPFSIIFQSYRHPSCGQAAHRKRCTEWFPETNIVTQKYILDHPGVPWGRSLTSICTHFSLRRGSSVINAIFAAIRWRSEKPCSDGPTMSNATPKWDDNHDHPMTCFHSFFHSFLHIFCPQGPHYVAYRCRTCDFDLCPRCYRQRLSPQRLEARDSWMVLVKWDIEEKKWLLLIY